MFGKKKFQGECEGRYTGEGVIDGIRFNERGGVMSGNGDIQAEAYIGFKNSHTSGNKRYPVYEYTVNGVAYKRAKTHVAYNSKAVEKMKDKPCKVLYDTENPGNSKAK